MKKGAWHEIYVNDTFAEELGPLSDPRLEKSLGDLPVHLMEGYRTEINLRALDWLKRISGSLERGYVLTFDYGYEHDQYFAPEHRDGTLLCYRRHTKNDNPYQCVGEQDITAHVDFTQLMEHGASLNLETVRFTDQSHYLLAIGETIIRQVVEQTAGQLSAERQAIHQLIHPELMGRTFKVLLQRKGAVTDEHWRSDPRSVMLHK